MQWILEACVAGAEMMLDAAASLDRLMMEMAARHSMEMGMIGSFSAAGSTFLAMKEYKKRILNKKSLPSMYISWLKSANRIPFQVRKAIGGCPYCLFFWISGLFGYLIAGFFGFIFCTWAYMALCALGKQN